jgi:hypothetical protein
MMNDIRTHYEIQMKACRDVAGLLQTIDIPRMITEAMALGTPEDMMILMALNNARPLLRHPDFPECREKPPEASLPPG